MTTTFRNSIPEQKKGSMCHVPIITITNRSERLKTVTLIPFGRQRHYDGVGGVTLTTSLAPPPQVIFFFAPQD